MWGPRPTPGVAGIIIIRSKCVAMVTLTDVCMCVRVHVCVSVSVCVCVCVRVCAFPSVSRS